MSQSNANNETAAINNVDYQQPMDVRMLSAWMENVGQYAESENDNTENDNIDTDESTCTDDESAGYTSEEDSEISDSDDESTEEYIINEPTPSEVVDICKVLDTDEYQEELAPERVEEILNIIENGGIVLDNTDPRFVEEAEMIKTFRNQRRLTIDEIAAIIDLQEGREPNCSDEVLERALEKVSSGEFISFDYEQNEQAEADEVNEADDEQDEVNDQTAQVTQPEQTEVNDQTTWWEWAFGTTQPEQTTQTEQPEITEPTKETKQEGTGCVMM
ncbi:Hypothetical protein PACV_37 [Pacmanvirus A23]|uniref:Hypothetical protein n=1 Tax=Pacmanvirus A23 TaxID=1932881 RepID=UPI000A0934F1|nr:Hypothetical protein B9W72_gp037 [Pacmanvirus A23]SIP85754.1 Hypothetical protein PACV_37 [Pacmanvirus A23]